MFCNNRTYDQCTIEKIEDKVGYLQYFVKSVTVNILLLCKDHYCQHTIIL